MKYCYTACLIVSLAFLSLGARAAGPATAPATRPAVRTIAVDEFEKLTKQPDAVILDVRTPKEFAEGHLPGAVNIDWKAKDFADKVAGLDKGKTYLVHCALGGRSHSACEKLGKLDFPNVFNLDGGLMAWQRAGKLVEKGEGTKGDLK